MAKKSILKRTNIGSALRVLSRPALWAAAAAAVLSIHKNFFILQKKAYKKKLLIPVVNVEHPLDAKIPFAPRYVSIYMDFTPCWIRALGFLLHNFPGTAVPYIKNYLYEVERMYSFAACVYSKIMSTTRRPRYTKSFLFNVIYLFDPHLMCIPSLHVMVVVMLYTKIQSILKQIDAEDTCAREQETLFQHAVAITDSILLVKQHSVNCVAAGMYAIHCFSPELFPPEEARRFTDALFRAEDSPVSAQDADEIRAFIFSLFDSFLEARKTAAGWEDVLTGFLMKR